MKSWTVEQAKASFSELLKTCATDGPQFITKGGAYAAVLVPITLWEQLQTRYQPPPEGRALSKRRLILISSTCL